ncbi:hypothetical protein [Vibrio phage 27Ua.3]|nr:hypothetical protein [Vibrio phage 27Ua.3]
MRGLVCSYGLRLPANDNNVTTLFTKCPVHVRAFLYLQFTIYNPINNATPTRTD